MADNFSASLATWREINLSELQKTLDAQGIELVENQKESVVGRKALADKTREFKRLPDEEKLTEIKGLLKAYQTEIDALTRRTKSAETAFLNLYKVLAEAPDPYPILEGALDQIINAPLSPEHELELKTLRAENAELKRRVSEISTLESAKRRAEERAEGLEKRMEESIREKVAKKESELNATYDERIMNYEEREKDLTRQLSLVQTQLRDLRSSNESSQARLLDQSQRQDSATISKLAELDIVLSDLERANSRVATVERRNESLRAELEGLKGSGSRADEEKIQSLESRVAELETELSSLLKALESQKENAEIEGGRMKKKLDEAGRELNAKSSEVEILRNKLKAFADYDEIKRELEIMKYVEFSNLDPSEDEEGVGLELPSPTPRKSTIREEKSLETLLASKNRRLGEELTRFRVLHSELEESFRSTSEELATAKAELEKQRVLTERLENDLMHVDKHMGKTHSSSGEGNGVGDRASTPTQSNEGLAGLGIGSNSQTAVRYTPIPFTPSSESSILPIVTSQRDRFRQRNAELEEELRKQYSIIEELRSDVRSLQADNLKLYEKIRFMQSYRDEAGAGTSTIGASTSATGYSRAQPRAGGGDGFGKYRTLYEQSVNPFEAFRGREAARAVQALNPLERGVLTLTQAILGNRRTRLFFIAYAMSLHALVLFTSYECMGSTGQTGTVVRRPP